MKKIITLILLSSFIGGTFGYTATDVSQANVLASKRIIKDWSSEPKNYRFDDYIARSEIMGMALAMAGIARNAHCRGDFVDVKKSDTDWVCRTIETAADKGYINAQKDQPKNKRKARPSDSITRAEALGILMKTFPDDGPWAGYSYYWSSSLPTNDSTTGYKDIYPFGAEWQAGVFYDYIRKVLQDDAQLYVNPRANMRATRGEVFDFAYTIMRYGEKLASDTSMTWPNPTHSFVGKGFTFSYPNLPPTDDIYHDGTWPPKVTIDNDVSKYSCPTVDYPEEQSEIRISKNIYCVYKRPDGAAGTNYENYSYSTVRYGKLLRLDFIIAYRTCGVYNSDAEIALCEKRQESFEQSLNGIIDQIVTSFRFTK